MLRDFFDFTFTNYFRLQPRDRMVLMPGNSFPLTYRAKVSGESHGESFTITSQLQFAYIKSILI